MALVPGLVAAAAGRLAVGLLQSVTMGGGVAAVLLLLLAAA
jgi:hypothetical protein